MMLKPQKKPERMLMAGTRRARQKARKMMKGMTNKINEMIR